jgi:predicted transcriptional regulator
VSNRRIDSRRVKKHFAYTIEEAAEALGVRKNTVRTWIKDGLAVADDRRPAILSGATIRAFLAERTKARKSPLRPGEFYCFRCRGPKIPAGGIADFVATGAELGTMTGICPDCETMMYRRTSLATLETAKGKVDVLILPQSEALKRDGHALPQS